MYWHRNGFAKLSWYLISLCLGNTASSCVLVKTWLYLVVLAMISLFKALFSLHYFCLAATVPHTGSLLPFLSSWAGIITAFFWLALLPVVPLWYGSSCKIASRCASWYSLELLLSTYITDILLPFGRESLLFRGSLNFSEIVQVVKILPYF